MTVIGRVNFFRTHLGSVAQTMAAVWRGGCWPIVRRRPRTTKRLYECLAIHLGLPYPAGRLRECVVLVLRFAYSETTPVKQPNDSPAPDRHQPRLSVVVLAWNTREFALRCVGSIVEHCDPRTTEVLVFDNASCDGTAAALRRHFPDVRVIESERNLGTARGFNLAMKEARGDLILRMEADAYVQDGVIQRMAGFMRASPGVGMLGCELRFPDGQHQHTPHRQMSMRLSALERFWLYRLLPERRRAKILLNGYWPADAPVVADWLAGITMIRREVFELTGGMDERFFLGGEESEWASRIQRSGYRIVYQPGLGVIYHFGSASWNQVWTDRGKLRRWHRVGVESYAAQHGRGGTAAYRLVEALGVLFRATVYATINRLRPDEYYESQARHYRMLFGFYLHLDERPGDRRYRETAADHG